MIFICYITKIGTILLSLDKLHLASKTLHTNFCRSFVLVTLTISPFTQGNITSNSITCINRRTSITYKLTTIYKYINVHIHKIKKLKDTRIPKTPFPHPSVGNTAAHPHAQRTFTQTKRKKRKILNYMLRIL